MESVKLSLCFLIVLTTVMMTCCAPKRKSDIIHFQESSETDVDVRPGNGNRNRNHRGRGKGHLEVREFEEGIPGVYPVRGPPQLPFVLPTSGQPDQQFSTTNTEKSTVSSTPNLIYIRDKTTASSNQYNGNPFLKNLQTTTTKSVPVFIGGITNQLPSSDKPSTTTPAYQNPRRTDLLYGSNLLEEEESNRNGKTNKSDEIGFDDRGLFDTAPHCQNGQILVNNRCRLQV